jgi:hypothetical protein
MGIRRQIENRIKRKEQEIADLQDQVSRAEAYIQGLQDTLKLLPRDGEGDEALQLRPDSHPAIAKAVLERVGKSLHVRDILSHTGKEQTKRSRLSMSGALAAYARRGEVFVKTGPNTFGLLEWEKPDVEEPPDDFGLESEEEVSSASSSDD